MKGSTRSKATSVKPKGGNWYKAGTMFAVVWIVWFILSMLFGGCTTYSYQELDDRLHVLDTRVDFNEWNNKAERCYVVYSVCKLRPYVSDSECWSNLEKCEINAHKKWKTIRKHKEGT